MQLRRSHIIRITFVCVGLTFLIRLFMMQVWSDTYKLAAEKNIIQPVVDQPYRGVIYDRHGQYLVYNVPIYDLMVIPKEVRNLDRASFCQDFGISLQKFNRAFDKAKAYSHVKPSVFFKGLSQETWAKLQDHLTEYPGFFVHVRTVRRYPLNMLAHTLGYVGDVSPQQLAADTYYKHGDRVGIGGLEKRYERVLRGERGISYQVRDVKGIVQGSFRGGALDYVSVPGKDLKTTLDSKLQLYGEQLMAHKAGSIVAIAPQTGAILALVSSPTYNPNLLTEGHVCGHFATLKQDALAPMLHRPIMALYPPGSILKLCQALIALQEKVIDEHTLYDCNNNLLNCHAHPSPLTLYKAITYSCNPFFYYYVFKRIINQKVAEDLHEDTCIGLEKWRAYLKKFGLGVVLGVDLPGEKCGHLPDKQFYDACYGKRNWKTSNLRSLAIGQGELLVTPLQMANLAAILANRGYYYTPFLVDQHDGIAMSSKQPIKHEVTIDPVHFELVVQAMQASVATGTSWRARIDGIAVCAKTGTAENPHGPDHSICIAFAPKEQPQIALAVCVEHAGWGARAAAAIAGLMIEQYLQGTISRPALQAYVNKGDFLH